MSLCAMARVTIEAPKAPATRVLIEKSPRKPPYTINLTLTVKNSGVLNDTARATVTVTASAEPPAPRFRRGDADGSGLIDLTDAIALLGYLFLGQAKPACLDAGDVDDTGAVEIAGAIYDLTCQFLGGPPPVDPGPGPLSGPDKNLEDPDLGCDRPCP